MTDPPKSRSTKAKAERVEEMAAWMLRTAAIRAGDPEMADRYIAHAAKAKTKAKTKRRTR